MSWIVSKSMSFFAFLSVFFFAAARSVWIVKYLLLAVSRHFSPLRRMDTSPSNI